MFSIGVLAKRTGVKVPTIRYYEQVGLLAAPERSRGNQRRYSTDEAERLGFIKHARDLGFSIEAIGELIELNGHPNHPCTDADRIAREQLASVRGRIERLRRLEVELERISGSCDGEFAGECYVLQALSDHGLCKNEH
ncbi:MAG: helix-turn-helix domain-containing protein [Pseudomonadota bacterium]